MSFAFMLAMLVHLSFSSYFRMPAELYKEGNISLLSKQNTCLKMRVDFEASTLKSSYTSARFEDELF